MSNIIWREADVTQIRGLVRERNALARENQALREAAQALHSTVNTFFLGDCDHAAVIRAQSRLVNILLASPLPHDSLISERMDTP